MEMVRFINGVTAGSIFTIASKVTAVVISCSNVSAGSNVSVLVTGDGDGNVNAVVTGGWYASAVVTACMVIFPTTTIMLVCKIT